MTASSDDITYALHELGPTIVGIALGLPRRDMAQSWADGNHLPTAKQAARLTVLAETFRQVAGAESSNVARAWLIGRSIGTEDTSPLEAIATDRFDEVRASARHMINDDWAS